MGDYTEASKQFAVLLKKQINDENIRGYIVSRNKTRQPLSTMEWALVHQYAKRHNESWETHAILGEAYQNDEKWLQASQQYHQAKELSADDAKQIPWLTKQINVLKSKTTSLSSGILGYEGGKG